MIARARAWLRGLWARVLHWLRGLWARVLHWLRTMPARARDWLHATDPRTWAGHAVQAVAIALLVWWTMRGWYVSQGWHADIANEIGRTAGASAALGAFAHREISDIAGAIAAYGVRKGIEMKIADSFGDWFWPIVAVGLTYGILGI